MQHFILQEDLSGPSVQITDKDLLHQMKSVLRFRPGDECIVLDGSGIKAKGKITELHRKGAIIELSAHEQCSAPTQELRLFCALSKKPSTFELIVQKATELGVTQITPLITEHTQVKELKKAERLQHIIREACEQSERCFLPRFTEPLDLKALAQELPSGTSYVGDARQGSELEPVDGDINLIIGPEGGLSDEELDLLSEAKLFRLEGAVLRMETAAIAALSLLRFK